MELAGPGGLTGSSDLVVLRSTNAEQWHEVQRFDILPDDRDPQFLATPDRLFLYDPARHDGSLTSLVTYTDNGKTWSPPQQVYHEKFIIWKKQLNKHCDEAIGMRTRFPTYCPE